MEQKSPPSPQELSQERLKLKQHLVWLKNDYSDEIPEEVIHSNNPSNKFKVRKNWFVELNAALWMAVDYWKFIKKEEATVEIQKFLTYITSEEFGRKPLTEARDIEWANRVIDIAVAEL